MPLPTNEIESELSYAYLHAIASRAGLNCKLESRHGDNYAVDALVDYFAPLTGAGLSFSGAWSPDLCFHVT
ncbi:hypothetical protein BH11BAC6_BH11BAC6_14490 [soil metagenome]